MINNNVQPTATPGHFRRKHVVQGKSKSKVPCRVVVLKNVKSYEILLEILQQLSRLLKAEENLNNHNYENNRVRFEFKSSDAAQKAYEFFNYR